MKRLAIWIVNKLHLACLWALRKLDRPTVVAGVLPPDRYPEKTVGNLKVGESGYAVPWMAKVSRDGKVYIRASYELDQSAHGTVKMKVERKKDGIHVFPPMSEPYVPSGESFDGDRYLPVAEVHGGYIVESAREVAVSAGMAAEFPYHGRVDQ